MGSDFMKRYFYFIPALIFSCLLFTSFSSSIDGRAVIAAKDDLPQGIFAKTVGYLPGDSISITNLKTKKTVDVLIIGTISASEGGAAIILTPEAAELLGITKRMNCTVKITKRTGQLDHSVSGTAVIGEGIATEAESDADEAVAAVKPEVSPPASEAEADDEAESTAEAEITEDEAEPVEEKRTEEEAEAAAEKVSEESAPLAEEKVPVEPEPVSEAVNNREEKIETPVAERVEADDALSSAPAEDPTPDTKAEDTKPLPYEAVEADKIAEEAVAAEKIAPENLTDAERSPAYEKLSGADGLPDNDPVLCETVTEHPEDIGALDKTIESKRVEADIPESLAAEEMVAPEPAKDTAETKESGAYAPIVLVPADLNPPEGGEEMTDSADDTAEDTAAPEKSEAPAPLPEPTPEAPASASTDKSATVSDGGALSQYIVPTLKELERGKYYIQIAVLKDVKSILAIIEKYKTHYPIAVVPLASGAAQQVLIGPLGIDEYGAVQNRFKADGYKDAFMRKIR